MARWRGVDSPANGSHHIRDDYQTEDLPKLADLSLGVPALWDKFQSYYAEVFEDGALSDRGAAPPSVVFWWV